MAYNDQRSYIGTLTYAAQNIVSTASGAIVVGTSSFATVPTGEPTFICGIGALAAAAPTCGAINAYVVVGTTTTTGSVFTPTLASAGGGLSTFIPPVPLTAGQGIKVVGIVATGTASATQTAPAFTAVVSLGPQFV